MKATGTVSMYVGILDGKGKVWGVRIPDAPGCYGGGPTPEAAIDDAASALAELVAEGHEIGLPRSIEAILANRKVKIDVKRGDILVLIKAPARKRRKERAVA